MTKFDPLAALSPLDGRYASKVSELRAYFSESALMRYRVRIEVEWLIHLCNNARLENTRELTATETTKLQNLYKKFTLKDAARIKSIESTTNHDVKAIEYFIKENLEKTSMKDLMEFVHFACTSEDINNLSYALMLKEAIQEVIMPTLSEVEEALTHLMEIGKSMPMLSHTHGQPASPTTVGKEIANVVIRLMRQYDQLATQEYLGKMNGAVGNWNAHVVAYPELDWITISEQFLVELELESSHYTTQIEPHDYVAEVSHTLVRLNNILMDLDRDLWMYIGKNYFTQKLKEGEVGSSTMPHKVNPIDFENSEGNLGLANAVLEHFAAKLPLSRMQRDLTDSTVLRNLGVALSYCLLAYKSTLRGLGKIDINETALRADLDAHWEILAEPLQTVMRRYKIPKPYEKLKELTRGKGLTKTGYQAFVKTLKIPQNEQARLLKLTPATYTGLAEKLTQDLL